MAFLDQVRTSARTILNGREESTLCLRLIDEIEKHLGDERGAWTYQAFSRWLNVASTDPLLLDCVSLLTTSSKLKALDVRFRFFDPTDSNGPGYVLSEDEVGAVFERGVLIHPETGEEVPDFKQHLYPFFVPVEELSSRVRE